MRLCFVMYNDWKQYTLFGEGGKGEWGVEGWRLKVFEQGLDEGEQRDVRTLCDGILPSG